MKTEKLLLLAGAGLLAYEVIAKAKGGGATQQFAQKVPGVQLTGQATPVDPNSPLGLAAGFTNLGLSIVQGLSNTFRGSGSGTSAQPNVSSGAQAPPGGDWLTSGNNGGVLGWFDTGPSPNSGVSGAAAPPVSSWDAWMTGSGGIVDTPTTAPFGMDLSF